MKKIKQNVQNVRFDELNNIAIWVNTSFIVKIRQSPIAKWALSKNFELAPNILYVELGG